MTVEEEEEEEREGTESVTFCSDCETIDIAMCGVVSVIIWDGATVGREKRWRAPAAAAAAVGGTTVIFRDSNRSTPSSGITRLRRMNSQLGDLSSAARRCLILFRS